jgi:hypothetical protein
MAHDPETCTCWIPACAECEAAWEDNQATLARVSFELAVAHEMDGRSAEAEAAIEESTAATLAPSLTEVRECEDELERDRCPLCGGRGDERVIKTSFFRRRVRVLCPSGLL